ncbi:transmembrane protein 8B-like [Ciona intestinalis]
MLTKVAILLLSLCFQTTYVDGTVYEEKTQVLTSIGPKRLRQFNGVGDQEVFFWRIENAVNKISMVLHGSVSQSGGGISVNCPDTHVQVVVRKGGIPIPNPLGAKLPENTFVWTDGVIYSGSFIVSATEGSQNELYVNLTTNQTGDYFAAAYLPIDSQHIGVDGLTKDCRYFASLEVIVVNAFNTTTTTASVNEITIHPNSIFLSRKQRNLFDVLFTTSNDTYTIKYNESTRFFWDINSLSDSGGTVKINIKSPEALGGNEAIFGCLKPGFSSNGECGNNNTIFINSSLPGAQYSWYLPFPHSGQWFIDVKLACEASACENISQKIELSVNVITCINSCQSNKGHGSCGLYRSDELLFGACKCKVGWKGLDCSDGSTALSYNTQLLYTLLLTMSNLLFLPCVCLAVYRKYYTEALVYFFVAFMSSFYHACDQPGQVVYCLMPYETLQFSDFLSSLTAIWFTLIAVAKFPLSIEAFFHVLGCLAFAVVISYDRFNLWTVVVPAVIAVAFVICSWVRQCCINRECYPGKKKTLVSIVPGIICAGTGLILYAFVETKDNYYIVHSMWHILMALAVLFLLPVGPKRLNLSYNVVGDASSASQSPPVTLSQNETNIRFTSYGGSSSSLNL